MSSAIQSPVANARGPRPLACVQCQQRKVKCDRQNPCNNCSRNGTQCVQAALAPRKRRFPERALLERLRRYEDLLRQNNIDFDPLHSSAAPPSSSSHRPFSAGNPKRSTSPSGSGQDDDDYSAVKSEPEDEKDFWQLMDQMTLHPNDVENAQDESPRGVVNKVVLKSAMDEMYDNHMAPNHLFFSAPPDADLTALHPPPTQILKLWQIYLQNVDPLLKITHTPTLQARILEASANLSNITPEFHSLLFAIYGIVIRSLDGDECQSILGLTNPEAALEFQTSCQQALLKAGFLRSNNLECLQALFLYLVAARNGADPRTLSSMVAVALKIAHRMGIAYEVNNAKYGVLEAELRRRLWWALVIFDNRMCELSDYKSTSLTPVWDCRIPLNVNDIDLTADLTDPPAPSDKPTETLVMVIRCEIADTIRNSAFHLEFSNPVLKATARKFNSPTIDRNDGSGGLITLEKYLEEKYLRYCNPEIATQFMAIQMTRTQMAKNRLLEHYSRYWWSSSRQTDEVRDKSIAHARKMLQHDTQVMRSPLSKSFRWLVEFYMPVPAYFHLFNELRLRPMLGQAVEIWDIIGDNYFAHHLGNNSMMHPFFRLLWTMAMKAWSAREDVIRRQGHQILDGEVPAVIVDMKSKVSIPTPESLYNETAPQTAPSARQEPTANVFPQFETGSGLGMNLDMNMNMNMNMGMGMGGGDFVPGWAMNFASGGVMNGMAFDFGPPMDALTNPSPMTGTSVVDPNQLDWTDVEKWNAMQSRRWWWQT